MLSAPSFYSEASLPSDPSVRLQDLGPRIPSLSHPVSLLMTVSIKGPGPRRNLASSLALCLGLKVGDVDLTILGEEEADSAPTLYPNAPTISVFSSGWSFRRRFREVDLM